jgi:hypothetical protein
MIHMENGPMVTDWLSGIGTAGALLVSTVLAFVSIVLAYKDRKGKRDAEAMERARVFARVEVDETHLRWSVVNASPFPVRQVNLLAVPFHTAQDGKKLDKTSAQFPCSYIAPNSTHKEELLRAELPEHMRLHPRMEAAVRLDFIDYQGTHWVRAANGRATPIEKLKGAGFDELPRTLYEPDPPARRWGIGSLRR